MKEHTEEVTLSNEELLKIFGTLDIRLVDYRDYCGDLTNH